MLMSPSDVDSQEASLSSAEIQQLVSATEQATGRVMQRASILRSSARPANAKSSTFGSPADPPIPASPLRPPSPAASSSESSKGKGFFSGLSESLQAMAAVMRPKPGPFVVPLCQAALRGDQPLIRRCLEEGANIDGRNEEGLTALICAINGGQHAAVQLLIKKGASVAARDSKGKTPLYRGTEVGDLRLISMLLQYGANVNDRSHTGKPFFVDAAINCDLQIVQLLLDHGADVNARDHTGRSVFILAVLAQNMPLIKLLAERGADVNARDITGRSALTLAILAGWMDLTKYLLDRGADSNCRDITGQPMLVHAVDKGNLELVKLLLWKGADPNAHDITGEVVFAMVIKKGNLQMARLFLAKGVDANQTLLNTGFGQTFLLHAIENEKWDLAALIRKHGANSNATDRLGKVPLLEAMQKNTFSPLERNESQSGDESVAHPLCSLPRGTVIFGLRETNSIGVFVAVKYSPSTNKTPVKSSPPEPSGATFISPCANGGKAILRTPTASIAACAQPH